MNPNEVKATEVWEVASALGIGMQDDLQTPGGNPPDHGGPVLPSETIKQRILAAQGLAPEPEPKATRLEDLQSLQDVMI